MGKFFLIMLFSLALNIAAQNKEAYTNTDQTSGLFDLSRLSVQHSLSFGMASTFNKSDLKSQSLYTTMLQYKFAAPVTVNLNFSLPIHSTFSSGQNFTPDNLSSFEYFKNVPFDFSINWQPTQNMRFLLNVSRLTGNSYYPGDHFYGFYPFYRDRMQD